MKELLKFIFTVILFQLILFPLFVFDLIYYNPLNTLSDITSNALIISILIALFGTISSSVAITIIFYLLGILVYYFLRRNIVYTDYTHLIEVFQSMSFFYSMLLIVLAIILYYIIYTFGARVKNIPLNNFNLNFRLVLFFFAISFFSILLIFPSAIYQTIKGHNIENFNKGATWKHGGQIYGIIYNFLESKFQEDELKKIKFNSVPFKYDPLQFPINRNVHLILLESFIPIEYVSDLQTLRNYHSNLPVSGKAISPVFGGQSAGAEFEILCGLPELFPLGNLTFNSLGDRNINFCLPDKLHHLGYKTLAFTGTSAHFHNAVNAYKAIGFDQHFSKKHLPKNDMDGVHVSDKVIYSFVREHIAESSSPLFTYTFTSAGHQNYALNKNNRPLIIESRLNSQYLNRLYYSQLELKEHIDKLIEIDPNALILFIGDHLTTAALEVNKHLNSYEMPFGIIINGKSLDFNDKFIAYNEISKILENLLEDKPSANIGQYFIARGNLYLRKNNAYQEELGDKRENLIEMSLNRVLYAIKASFN